MIWFRIFFYSAFCISLMSCSSTKPKDTPATNDYFIEEFSNLRQELSHYALLATYTSSSGKHASERFAELGYDVSYFEAPDRLIFKYPRTFILSKAGSNNIFVIFLGTRSSFEWLQNAKAVNYSDVSKSDTYLIPSGHAGFRRAVLNLIEENFSQVIVKHAVKFRKTESLKVTLIGYSQGAAIAQLAAPYIEGYKYYLKNSQFYIKDSHPNITIQKIVTFAPPYAVSTFDNSWQMMEACFGKLTYQVIRDNDLVSSVYNVANNGKLFVMHFGNLIRITRDGDYVPELTHWGRDVDNSPHSIYSYYQALSTDSNVNSSSPILSCENELLSISSKINISR